MFFVFNKEKVYSYIISLSTVVVLFFVASMVLKNNTDNNVVQTGSNVQKELPIYNVETDEDKVSLTVNCAW